MSSILNHLPVIVVILPLSAGLLAPLASVIKKDAGKYLVTFCGGINLLCVIRLLMRVIREGRVMYTLGGWEAPYGIEFSIDGLNILMLVLVATVGFSSMIFSHKFTVASEMNPVKSTGFYALLSLLMTGLSGMSVTGDIFNLYVFLEVTSLSGYSLISTGGYRGNVSAFRYLMFGTIGASFYLMGVGILYANTGTLNMRDLAELCKGMFNNGQMVIAVACIVVGFGIKMALFPLHGWQPAAHSFAHPGADPMIAGTMVKVPAYAMLRFLYFILPREEYAMRLALITIGVMGAMGVIYGSLKALQQRDLRRMLAYSSVAQIGYIGIGFSIGTVYGVIGAALHIINHAFMKGGLFFACGAIEYKYHATEIKSLGQLYKKMPITVACIVIEALSMMGIPPTAGFFSKWYIALGAAQSGKFVFIAVLVASSLLTAGYFFRLLENIFMGSDKQMQSFYEGKKCEIHWTMLLPVMICGVAVVLLGLFNTSLVSLLETAFVGVM